MDDLWMIIAEFAISTHADRILMVADILSTSSTVSAFDCIKYAFGPNVDKALLDRFVRVWKASPDITTKEIASAFRSVAQVVRLMESHSGIELVWTGPKTELIPTRKTEMVMLEVINSAQYDLFLVTYVFYKASSIVAALRAAVSRGVTVSILIESSIDQGGSVPGGNVNAIRDAVADASIYIWDTESKGKGGDTSSSVVHAKCAVADSRLAFITSANLTTAALERNMELGMLIKGGTVPNMLRQHLEALITTKVISIQK